MLLFTNRMFINDDIGCDGNSFEIYSLNKSRFYSYRNRENNNNNDV